MKVKKIECLGSVDHAVYSVLTGIALHLYIDEYDLPHNAKVKVTVEVIEEN